MINTLQTPFIAFPPPLVSSKIIVEEISLKSEDNTSSNLVSYVSKNNGIILRYCNVESMGM
jgi:hypothetical protein